MFYDENILVEIHYWNEKTLEDGIIKNCKILNDFVYCRIEFVLACKTLNYYVCVLNDGNLLSVWSHKKSDGDMNYLPSEVMGEFRKKFSKNNLAQEDVELFINNPKKYRKEKFKRKK